MSFPEQGRLSRSVWAAGILICVLLLGCGDSATKENASPIQSAEALDARRARIAKELADAQAKRKELIEDFIRDLLSNGPLPKAAVVTAAEEIGIGSDEMSEAADRLDVVTVEGDDGPMWKLPDASK